MKITRDEENVIIEMTIYELSAINCNLEPERKIVKRHKPIILEFETLSNQLIDEIIISKGEY